MFLASLFPSWALADVGAARPAINEAAMTNSTTLSVADSWITISSGSTDSPLGSAVRTPVIQAALWAAVPTLHRNLSSLVHPFQTRASSRAQMWRANYSPDQTYSRDDLKC